MTSDEFRRQMAGMFLQPSILGVMAIALCVVWAWGYLSLRALRRLPDLPHKREMMAGARWGWAGMASCLALACGGSYLAGVYTRYPVTSGFGAQFLLLASFALAGWAFPRQMDGVTFVFFVARQRIRGREVSAAAWLELLARREKLKRYPTATAVCMLAMLVFMWVCLTLAFTYPVDAEFAKEIAEQEVADRLADGVRDGLALPYVQKVSAFGPHPKVDPLLDLATMDQIVDSAREILRLRSAEDQAPPGEYHLFVEVTAETTDDQARDILAQAQNLLADCRDPHHWRIAVYSRGSKLSAHGFYPPTKGEE